MTMVQKLPKLSREDEMALCLQWEASANTQARDELVRCHLRYVVAIALKYRRYGLPLSELIAEGTTRNLLANPGIEPEPAR